MEYLNIPYVIQSVSVGIKAKPHFATLDCRVATSLLLAMTVGRIQIFLNCGSAAISLA